jgi:F0F1-type ATP synthase membrane subunit c/vacuolar-type H+-ATPase subunit K
LFNHIHLLLQAGKVVGAGLCTVSIAGSGIGIGIVFGAFTMALARQPRLEDVLFKYTLLGFAFTESIALFGLMTAFMILFALGDAF